MMTTRKDADLTSTRLDEVARLLALLIGRDRPLQDTIGLFDSVGFGPTRIAELLGTTPGYVSVAITRSRKQRRSQKDLGRTQAK